MAVAARSGRRPSAWRRRSIILLIAAAVALAAAGVGAVARFRPLDVPVARIENNVAVQVFGLGTVEARVVSRVGFQVGGTLAELRVDHGERVVAGAVLARLDAREQEARLAKAEAAVIQAEASQRRAAANLDKAKTNHAQRQLANERRQTLLRRGSASREAAEESQAAEDIAAAEVALAQSEVSIAEAVLADARAQRQLETVQLERHRLVAPYDALVVQRHKELGTALGPGEPLFTLIDPKTVWALAHIDEAAAGGLQPGQKASVRLRSLPREPHGGTVVRIDIESDRVTEERRIYVACEQCPTQIHLGEQAEVLVTTAVLDRAVLVPEVAVEGFDGASGTVWTVEDGRLRKRKVSFGHKTLDGRLQVVGGLADDALAVAEIVPGLREGRAARPAAGEGP